MKQEKSEIDNTVLPVLPLKDTLVFPYLIVPLMITDAEQTKLVGEIKQVRGAAG